MAKRYFQSLGGMAPWPRSGSALVRDLDFVLHLHSLVRYGHRPSPSLAIGNTQLLLFFLFFIFFQHKDTFIKYSTYDFNWQAGTKARESWFLTRLIPPCLAQLPTWPTLLTHNTRAQVIASPYPFTHLSPHPRLETYLTRVAQSVKSSPIPNNYATKKTIRMS